MHETLSLNYKIKTDGLCVIFLNDIEDKKENLTEQNVFLFEFFLSRP